MYTKHVVLSTLTKYPVGTVTGEVTIANDTLFAALTTLGVPKVAADGAPYLSPGAMIMVDAETHTVVRADGTTDGTVRPNKYYFAWNKSGVIYTSVVVDKNLRVKPSVETYVAAVKQVTKIGYNGSAGDLALAASPVEGDILTIRTVDLSMPEWDARGKKNYQYTVKSTDTRATAIAAITSLINADVKRTVNAVTTNSGSNYGYTLTAVTAGVGFAVTADDALYGSAIQCNGSNSTVLNVTGKGSATQVAKYIKDASVSEGNINSELMPDLFWKTPNGVNTALNYDSYTIILEGNGTDKKVNPIDSLKYELTLYYNNAASSSGEYGAVLVVFNTTATQTL